MDVGSPHLQIPDNRSRSLQEEPGDDRTVSYTHLEVYKRQVLGLSITQTPLGVMALIGVIMLMGIVVKNGIVLIDYTILCRERGMSILTAAVTAGKSRLRPVLMTTLTTVLAMIPLAVGPDEGSEMWRPMGLPVAAVSKRQ